MTSPSKVIILGCGSSGGVPSIGVDGPYWGSCDPSNIKNHRTRASFYIEYATGQRFLVDTSPDLRQQYLKHQLQNFNAVLYSHDHADHTHGIDELRYLYFARDSEVIPVYADCLTLQSLRQRFSYLFKPKVKIYPIVLDGREIKPGRFDVDGVSIYAIEQGHGKDQKSFGFRFGNVAYSPDFNILNEQAIEAYQNLDLWVVDCLSYEPKKTHNHLDLALHWIERVRPKKAVLTHMNAGMDYNVLKEKLPKNVEPAYDGLTFLF